MFLEILYRILEEDNDFEEKRFKQSLTLFTLPFGSLKYKKVKQQLAWFPHI